MKTAQGDFDEPRQIGLESDSDFEASVVEVRGESSALSQVTSPEAGAAAPVSRPHEDEVSGQPAWAGKILGHFRLLRPLGEGAMGKVIQAQDVHLNRIVALKVLRKRIRGMREEDRVRQFLREARAAASIDHPNVVPIYEINSHSGWWYIAMEMLEGGNLQTVVKAAGPLRAEQACPIIADAATALAAAHQAGIIHRDVKPGNLMLTRTGRCKVTDFGLVRLDDPNDPFDLTNRSVGTPHYMAPEVIRQRSQTPAIDVYGLGGTLYYALTGELPFLGVSSKEIIRRHLKDTPPDSRDKAPNCPASLARLIQRAMAKEPSERPSAAEFALALRAESIGSAPLDGHPLVRGSDLWVATGSSLQLSSAGSRLGLGASTGGASGVRQTAPGSVMTVAPETGRFWKWVAAGMIFALLLGVVFLVGRMGSPTGSSPVVPAAPMSRSDLVYTETETRTALTRLAQRFSSSPASYGLLKPNVVPAWRDPRLEPPSFSWKGKVDTTGIRFVASREGRHYFPADGPEAVLVTRGNFRGYRSAQEAEADGKVPVPR